jgi:hypothetical protein
LDFFVFGGDVLRVGCGYVLWQLVKLAVVGVLLHHLFEIKPFLLQVKGLLGSFGVELRLMQLVAVVNV